MASKGKKTGRAGAIDGLTAITSGKAHRNVLWQAIMDAQDNSLVESGQDNVKNALRWLLATQASPIPDHMLVLTLSSALEQVLEAAIATHFVLDEDGCKRMFDDSANGPLSNFAAKIKTAYALGIFPKAIRDDLDMIRHIRNAFAHAKKRLDFSTPEVIAGCNALIIPDHYQRAETDKPRKAKARFTHCAQALYVYLEWPSPGPMSYRTHKFRDFLSVLPA